MQKDIRVEVSLHVDTSRYDDLQTYFYLLSISATPPDIDPKYHEMEKRVYAEIAKKMRSGTFKNHPSIREQWFRDRIETLYPSQEIERDIYELARNLLKYAR
jgi:hypothetical protein